MSIEYKIEKDADGYEVCCNRCGLEDVEIHWFDWDYPKKREPQATPKEPVCEYCANITRPDEHRNEVRLMHTLEARILRKLKEVSEGQR